MTQRSAWWPPSFDVTRPLREQMLCIVTPAPAWTTGETALTQDLCKTLETALGETLLVHFASIAVLPPRPVPEGAKPGEASLMLELVVDEGFRPADAIHMVIDTCFQPLWAIYGCMARGGCAGTTEGLRRNWLADYLDRHVVIADCAFVGARDRSVSQIRDENRLLVGALRAHRDNVYPERDARAIALVMAGWAAASKGARWASAPAQRSWWRAAGAGIAGKLGFFVVWLLSRLALPLVLYAIAYVAAWLAARRGHAMPLQVVLAVGRTAVAVVVVLACLALLALIVLVLLRMFVPGWRPGLSALDRELDLPVSTRRATLVVLSMYATIAFIVVIAAMVATQLFVDVSAALRVIGAAGAAGLIAAAFVVGFYRARRRIGFTPLRERIDRWLTSPEFFQVERSSQVHPSLDKSEGELASRTAHMVSLTEIRAPVPWNRFWLRVFLRTVNLIGRVLYTEGRLGDAANIKFGHWHIVDGSRLLFCTNYDGAFGGYLDDFINGGAVGMTGFWRWTHLEPRAAGAKDEPCVEKARQFPPTRLIVFRGVKCEQWFKTYARDSMIPNSFRFDAYNLTYQQIDRATRLRNALFGERTPLKDDQIMRALES